MNAAERAVKIPWLPVADIFVQQKRLILRQDADGIDPGIDAIRQRKVYDAIFGPERNRGLGDIVRQSIQPAALSSRKQHCYTFFLSLHFEPPH